MAETALHPRLEKLDMDQARNLVHSDIANSAKNGPMAVHDVLHTVAFQGQTVGAPLMCNPAVADTLQVRPAPRGIPRASCPPAPHPPSACAVRRRALRGGRATRSRSFTRRL